MRYYGSFKLFIFFYEKISHAPKSTKKHQKHQQVPKSTKKHQQAPKSTKNAPNKSTKTQISEQK